MADRTAEERAREIVRPLARYWDIGPVTSEALISDFASAIRTAEDAVRERCALIADAAARSLDGDESVYIREVAASNAETLVKIVRDDARQDHLSAATGLILHAAVRARQVAGDRAARAIRSREADDAE